MSFAQLAEITKKEIEEGRIKTSSSSSFFDGFDRIVGTNLGGNNDRNSVIGNASRELNNLTGGYSNTLFNSPKKYLNLAGDTATAVSSLDQRKIIDQYKRNYTTLGGDVAQAGFGVMGVFGNNEFAQSFLKNKTVNQASFGYGQDLAGTLQGTKEAADTGLLSSENRNSAIRFGVKTAAVVGGAEVVSQVRTGFGLQGYSMPSLGAPSLLESAAIYGAVKAGGTREGAAKYLEQQGYVPPELTDDAKDWLDFLPDIDYPKITNPPKTNPADPSEFNPWRMFEPTSTTEGFLGTDQKAGVNILPILLIGAAIFIIYKARA